MGLVEERWKKGGNAPSLCSFLLFIQLILSLIIPSSISALSIDCSSMGIGQGEECSQLQSQLHVQVSRWTIQSHHPGDIINDLWSLFISLISSSWTSRGANYVVSQWDSVRFVSHSIPFDGISLVFTIMKWARERKREGTIRGHPLLRKRKRMMTGCLCTSLSQSSFFLPLKRSKIMSRFFSTFDVRIVRSQRIHWTDMYSQWMHLH